MSWSLITASFFFFLIIKVRDQCGFGTKKKKKSKTREKDSLLTSVIGRSELTDFNIIFLTFLLSSDPKIWTRTIITEHRLWYSNVKWPKQLSRAICFSTVCVYRRKKICCSCNTSIFVRIKCKQYWDVHFSHYV